MILIWGPVVTYGGWRIVIKEPSDAFMVALAKELELV
jgi:hypothetical protein